MDEEINKFRHDWQMKIDEYEREKEKRFQEIDRAIVHYVFTILLSALTAIVIVTIATIK